MACTVEHSSVTFLALLLFVRLNTHSGLEAMKDKGHSVLIKTVYREIARYVATIDIKYKQIAQRAPPIQQAGHYSGDVYAKPTTTNIGSIYNPPI